MDAIARPFLALIGGISVFLAVVSGVLAMKPLIAQRITKLEQSAASAIEDLMLTAVTPRKVTIWTASIAVVSAIVGYTITGSLLLSIALVGGAGVLPTIVFRNLRRARLAEFDERLPAALDQLASATRAGLSLSQALEDVAATAPAPISDEFALIVREVQLGTELPRALRSAEKRVASRHFTLVVSALLVSIDKGGNLPEALQTISASLKEVWRLEQKLLTASAEGRKAMLVIGSVPVFVLIMVMLLQPDLASELTSSIFGVAILICAVLLYVGGIGWLRRILGTAV